jgi:hypothetical protein
VIAARLPSSEPLARPRLKAVSPSWFARRIEAPAGEMLIEWSGWVPGGLGLEVDPYPVSYRTSSFRDFFNVTITEIDDGSARLEIEAEPLARPLVKGATFTLSPEQRFVALEIPGRRRVKGIEFVPCLYLVLVQRGE